jgi:hypothetical protein
MFVYTTTFSIRLFYCVNNYVPVTWLADYFKTCFWKMQVLYAFLNKVP